MGIQNYMVKKACKECKRITESTWVCPNCGGLSFSESWRGRVIVIDPHSSRVAERLGVDAPGRHALNSQRRSSRRR